MANGRWIYRLDELGKEHSNFVGKKCANLGEMTRAGFRIPQGFSLSLGAYERFIKETGALEKIHSILSTFSADPNKSESITKYEETSRTIRGLLESKEMPTDMEDMIQSFYEELSKKTVRTDLSVATRSAGPASHPGQYETYLHVRGISDLIKNIIKVWSSTFNTRSLINRARGGFPLDFDPIGVAVLQMVNAKSAGVMFTLNPIDGDPSKIVIEGNWGLGESVVGGEITPDRWTVDKVVFEITESTISSKIKEYNLDPGTGKPSFVALPPEKQNMASLNKEEILELCKIAKDIEKHFGVPQDIEWAIDKDLPFPKNIFMLQARIEQVWSKRKAEPKLKMAGNWGKIVGSVMRSHKQNETDHR